MPLLYKKDHYLPKRDQRQFFASLEKFANSTFPSFSVKLPNCLFDQDGDQDTIRSVQINLDPDQP